jgi:hypothetical protein
MKISPVRAELLNSDRRAGRTDMTKPIDAFRSFAISPKICTFSPQYIYVYLYVSRNK